MSHTATVNKVTISDDERTLRQMEQDLISQGINVELVRNAVPRMYYNNQIAKHLVGKNDDLVFHANPDECDYVLKVKDAYYDIGFIKNKDGNLVPIFDDYDYASHCVEGSSEGKGAIKEFLGAKYDGADTQHWSGEQSDTDQILHSMGKALQSYSVNAAINSATDSGYTVMNQYTDEDGSVHIEVEV
tara:strand:+ start:2290 stop:2850 length:561 start_codon:yes stop_codon:yes gene_type:complete